jgi:CRISPR/Cas system-associated exonuclease Cas4 (RecB family)
MDDFEAKLNNLLIGDKLERLLFLEKERRCIDRKSLLFLGMSNIAEYYWCAIQSVLKSRANELLFFASYLYDRIAYAHQLSLVDTIPRTDVGLLETGNKLTLSDVEKVLTGEAKRLRECKVHDIILCTEEFTDKHGNRVVAINPGLSPDEKARLEKEATARGARIIDLEKNPKLRGEFLQTIKAEKYPTIRWNFEWEKYIVIGVPDGITERFVYEFKTTRNRFLASFEKPVAFMQADLYGYFFKRKNKRVQIYIIEEDKIETYEESVNMNRTINVLTNFAKVDAGWVPPLPKPWKCNHCDFKERCSINRN